MNKVNQIKNLVQHAVEALDRLQELVTVEDYKTNREKLLTELFLKAAEIDIEDWNDCARVWIYDTIKTYNSQLKQS